jgi:hypothetical protein
MGRIVQLVPRAPEVPDKAHGTHVAPDRTATYLRSWHPFFEDQQKVLVGPSPVAAKAWAQAWEDIARLCERLEGGDVQSTEEWEEDLLSAFHTVPRFPEVADRSIESYAALRRLFDAFGTLIQAQELDNPDYQQVSESAGVFDDLAETTNVAVQSLLRDRPVPALAGLQWEFDRLRQVREGKP